MPSLQEISFRRLLSYVWEQSGFYRDYYGSHGLREKDLAELAVQDLPFLTKKTLMENFDKAVTNPRLRRQEIEKWAHENLYPQQNFCNDFVIIRSSGTSGYQGTFVYDETTWRAADLAIAGRLPVPENYPGRTRVAWHIDSYGRRAADLAAAVRMPKSLYETLILSLVEDPEVLVTRLNTFQPHRLFGYSSCVSVLADFALHGKLHIQPKRIFVSGDLLTEGMRNKIQVAWGAPIFEFYAASEALYIAVKDCSKDEMDVIKELNIVEVLDGDHRAVSPGEQGRVVLTNLHNYVLPVLRYELGDYVGLGKGLDDSPSTAATLRYVRGRVNDALPVVLRDGRRDSIHPLLLPIYVPGLEKIQFISRRPDRVQIDYVAPSDIDVAIRRGFQEILDLKGATRTSFTVRRVSHIANDPQTGKFPIIRIEGDHQENLSRVGATLADSQEIDSLGPVNSFIEFRKQDIEQSIPDRFEEIVQKYPDRIAVKTGSRALTYYDLNRAANRVAGGLLKVRGAGTEPVALYLDHGANLIGAILGVLKAGKIYVYLDPTYPVKRIDDILRDSQAALIVTDNKNRDRLKESAPSSIVHLNIDDLDPSLSKGNPTVTTSPDALAWLLYTSGSTGRPKGVVHNHRNLLHNIMTYTNSMHICAQDRLSLLHSCNVITSVKNLLGALLNGAAVYPFNVRERGLQRLIAWMIEEGITVYHSVPSLFRHFCDAVTGEKKFPTLRLIALGSEPVTKRDVDQYKKHFSSDSILVNILGNTEMGTYRQYFVDKNTPIIRSIVPAGYAVEDKEIHLLDDAGREVIPGDIGEIAVKSRYLAVGYWRDPDATKASFIADPNGGDERLYLTGDLGRMATDGCLTYLGRKDFQVKIRGHRVDLAEVEMALLDYAAVKEAVVVAQDDPRKDKRVVAYVVPNETETPSWDQLRTFMELRLPDYMVPSAFVRLDRLPLSPDGKVDRQALPRPDHTGLDLEETFVAPRTPMERQIASIWGEVQLGEIEAVLAEHPAVGQAAVHLWKVQANDVRIVACCVPANAGALAPVSLRKHLRARLPDYMIPQYFVPVEQIPLMPNGKIDRNKLPVPVVTESRIGQHEAPSDPVETAIAEIWTNLISPARPIGRADKFFEMGGHSLLALQALRQIENKLGVRLDFRVLFQESLADIATQCRSERIAHVRVPPAQAVLTR
jgi:amino acid adenylation domain-containing protein